MKKKGCCSDFTAERDADLRAAWCRQFDAAPASVSRREIMRLAVESPARRFWVSESEAVRVVKRMLRHGVDCKCVASRREIYTELHRRVSIALTERSGSISDIIIDELHKPAPRFYLTPESAHAILSRKR